MARPRKEPHPVWRKDTAKWYIADGRRVVPIEPAIKARGPAADAELALAVARYVVAKAAAATAVVRTDRDLTEVSVAEVLDRYLERRTSDDPAKRKKTVARPGELVQRIARLAAFWGDRMVSDISEATCEEFEAFCGSSSYARRCLGDAQSALNEAKRAALFRTPVQVTLPAAPRPREDHLTLAEAVYLVRLCLRRRDGQHRAIWRHVARFIIVAIATCSRSSRVYEASYAPEAGRPWVDLEGGVLYRMAPGEVASKKRAPSIDLSPRLVAAMRRWSTDRVINGVTVTGDHYVCQWRGHAADPKGAYAEAVDAAMDAARADDEADRTAGRKPRRLFLRADGRTPKVVVRHTLRHTGVTWLAETPGVDVEDVCSYAGMTRSMFDRVYGHAHKARSRKIVAAQSRKAHKGINRNLGDRDDAR